MTGTERSGSVRSTATTATVVLTATLVIGLLLGPDTGGWVFLTVHAVLTIALCENRSQLAGGPRPPAATATERITTA